MKFETLLARYKNLGYPSLDLEQYLESDKHMEIDGIIDWLYTKHDIFVGLLYHDHINIKSYNKIISIDYPKINRFVGVRIWNATTEYSNTNYDEQQFDNPYDAKFNTVKNLYKALKFQKY